MAKYVSGTEKNLKVGLSSFSENKTSLTVVGNVGIGTTNATSNLHVNGDVIVTGVITATSILPSTDNTGVVGNTAFTWSNGQFTNFLVNDTLTVRAAIDLADSDILQFGTSDDVKVFYDGTANDLEIELEASATKIAITDNGTYKHIITKDGKVGINTSITPTNQLDVNGSAKVNGLIIGSGTTITGVDDDLTSVSSLDDTLASAKAIKSYVDLQVSGSGSNNILSFDTNSGIGSVYINSEVFDVLGVQNEIETIGSGTTLTIGLPDNVRIQSSITVGSAVTINSSGINAPTGIITASTFSGQINAGVSTLGITTTAGLSATQLSVSGVSTFAGITTVTGTTLFSRQLNVSGVSTLGITTTTGLSATQLSISGVSTFAGITTVTGTTLFSRQLNVSGISTLGITTTAGLSATQLSVSGVSTFAGITTVTGTTLFSRQLNVSGVSTFNNTLNVVPTSTGIAGLFSGTTSSDMVRITQLGTGNALLVEDSTNPDSSPFVISASGSVGIGTTNPFAGTINNGIDVVGSINPIIFSRNTDLSGNTESSIWAADGDWFSGPSYKGVGLRNYSPGYSGNIFDSIPFANGASLAFQNTNYGLIYTNGGSPLIFATVSTEALRIDTSQRVGIGTINPTSKLHVVGDGNFTGQVTASSFSGNASSATYATNAGLSTNLKGGLAGNLVYQSATDTTAFLANGSSGTILKSNGVGNAPSWVAAAPANAITGLTIRDEGNVVGSANNVSELNFVGNIVSVASTLGIATITFSNYVDNAGIATYATTAGVATALQNARTFEITGDIVASPISFDGTGNVSLAATIQPNSVALGGDTTGDYVQSISGTSNQITVTGGTGEGSTPTLSIPNQFTIPQDATVTRDLQVNRNLNVTGNITIGGTSATIFSQTLNIFDPDIVLGFRTDGSGNDVSTDTTANHGGIAIASTEGTPLVSLYDVGIGETNPATYKKFMWFKSGTFSGLGTDAWISNYAIGIGSTQVPNGVRLAAGGMQVTDSTLSVPQLNISGVSTFTGAVSFGTSAYFGDNDIAYFGDGNDLRIYHSGSNSFIDEVGTGDLFLRATNIYLQQNGGETALKAIQNGAVELYYDNSKKFETTGYGATVYGTLESQGLFSSGIGTISVNTSTDALRITQLGSGNALVVEDSTNPDSSPFVVNASGSVGIGTTNPTSKLQVDGNVLVSGVSTFIGNGTAASPAIFAQRDSGNNAGIKLYGTSGGNWVYSESTSSNPKSLIFDSSQSENILFRIAAGTKALIQPTGELLVGTGTSTGTASQLLQVNSGGYFNGSVGIGTTNPTSKLHVIGDVLVSGIITSTDYNSTSDINLKENIQKIENPIDKVLQLNGVSFNWKESGRKSIGVIAQEVEKVIPELVNTGDVKTVNYNGLVGLLIEVVKEQQKEIDYLKSKIG